MSSNTRALVDQFTEWMVGFRDGSVIDHVVVPEKTAVAAAAAVRVERPGVLIAAVIGWPDPANRYERIEYSDMPPRYRELRRFNGPLGDHHGYMVVWPGRDGKRSSLLNRSEPLLPRCRRQPGDAGGFIEDVLPVQDPSVCQDLQHGNHERGPDRDSRNRVIIESGHGPTAPHRPDTGVLDLARQTTQRPSGLRDWTWCAHCGVR